MRMAPPGSRTRRSGNPGSHAGLRPRGPAAPGSRGVHEAGMDGMPRCGHRAIVRYDPAMSVPGGSAAHPSGDKRFKILDAAVRRHQHQADALLELLHARAGALRLPLRRRAALTRRAASGCRSRASTAWPPSTTSSRFTPQGRAHLHGLPGHRLLREGGRRHPGRPRGGARREGRRAPPPTASSRWWWPAASAPAAPPRRWSSTTSWRGEQTRAGGPGPGRRRGAAP